jgi:ATP-dependent DNA helicase RecQ
VLFTVKRDELYRLHADGGRADQVIQMVLRLYTGLFTDYAYIREEEVAQRTGLTRHEVYETLKILSARHILSYIPRKKTPYIIYTRAREDAATLVIPRTVYEERKERYRERIDAMVAYVDNSTTCRSRVLLRYFDEKSTHNCGHCDVCLERKKKPALREELRALGVQICELLATDGPLTPAAIAHAFSNEADADFVGETLRMLMEEQQVTTKDGLISLSAVSAASTKRNQ